MALLHCLKTVDLIVPERTQQWVLFNIC